MAGSSDRGRWAWFPVTEATGELVETADGQVFPSWAVVRMQVVETRTVDGQSFPETSETEPTVRIRIEMQDGRAVPTQVTVARPDGGALIASDFREPSMAMVEQAVKHVAQNAFARLNPPPLVGNLRDRENSVDLGSHAAWGQAISGAGVRASSARRRRPVTDERLREVAIVYSRDLSGAPTKAVADALHYSQRTASRLVALAKKRGLIAPTAQPEEKS